MTDGTQNDRELNQTAKDTILSTWNTLLEIGISREAVASFAFSMAVSTLVDLNGREGTAKSFEDLADKVRSGIFDGTRK